MNSSALKSLPSQILESNSSDEIVAVSELIADLKISELAGVIFFCSAHYDLEILTSALNSHFDCPLIGCTTAGEIAGKYKSDSIVALAFSNKTFVLHPLLIENLQTFDLADSMQLANTVERQLQYSARLSAENMFGFLLSDGLSLKEENLIARLSQSFDSIDIFGGSAGDNLEFGQTFVFYNGQFYSNAAVLTIFELKDDFCLFKTQHFVATSKELITTEVDFEKRIVKEINGQPAAIAYANINGLNSDSLTSMDFAMYPLMINLSDEWYIRSIANVYPDKSLQFYCAIDDGLPLSVAEGHDMLTRLEECTEGIIDKFEEIYFTLGCDCILRRLENINKNKLGDFDSIFSKLKFIGFNSYGEQFNGVHFNQTMAGVVVGKLRHE